MSRLLPEELKGENLVPLCFATSLNEAKGIESILDKGGVDYTFEIAPIASESVFSVLFGSNKKGVIFLVPSIQYEHSVKLLDKSGLSGLIIG